jgi:hypothetical protein
MAFRSVRRLEMLLFALLARDYRSENPILKCKLNIDRAGKSSKMQSTSDLLFGASHREVRGFWLLAEGEPALARQ